jgi:hypothetical protein
VKPYGVARIGVTQAGPISIRTQARASGSFLFQQS